MIKSNSAFLLILVISGFLLYLPAITAGFLYDDFTVIVDNSVFKSGNFLKAITEIGKSGIRQDMFRPLAMASYYFNYRFNDLHSSGYRIFNLLIGIINAYLLYLVLSVIFPGLDRKIAQVAVLWFLLLPLNNQALIYITARFTLLFSLFFLLGFYFYIKNRPFISAICFLLGLMCKEEMLIFPLILGIYELSSTRNFRYYFKTLIIISGAGILFLIMRFLGGRLGGWDRSYVSFNWRFLLSQMGFFIYNWKAGVSSPVVMHDLRALNFSFLYPFILLCIILGIYLVWKRQNLGILFLYPWILIAGFSCFLNGPHRAMEYRFYLANILYVIIFVTIIKKVTRKWRWWIGTVFIILSLWFSFFRVLEYRDKLVLWANTVKKYPRLPEAHVNYGRELTFKGLYKPAVAEFEKAIKLAPWDYFAFYNLGLTYAYMEDYHKAREAFLKTIHIAPSYAPGHYNLGLTYLILGDKIKAQEEFAKARELGWTVKVPEIKDGKN